MWVFLLWCWLHSLWHKQPQTSKDLFDYPSLWKQTSLMSSIQNGNFYKKEVSTLLELRSCNQATFNEMIPGFLYLLWGISHNHPSLEKENNFVFIFYFHLHKETFAINFHINITDALHAFLFVQRHYIWYEQHQINFFFQLPPVYSSS